MEKRSRNRFPSRLTCEIAADGQRYSGLVRDLTDRGLFIQTLANPAPNSVVEVIFSASDRQPSIRFEAGVARKRIAPPRLQAAVPSGIGLEVLPPRNDYERWLVRPNCPSLNTSAVAGGTQAATGERMVKAYRFRLIRHANRGSQVITIRCETAAGARARALARAGAGWKIADVQVL